MGDKKYHYLYKTVIPTHGYYYYGIHSTDNLYDGYQGSGTYIKRFKKQGYHLITGIVEFYNSRKELLEAERQIVNERLVRDVKCLNLTTGGNYTPPKRGVTKATRKKISIIHIISTLLNHVFLLYPSVYRPLLREGRLSDFPCLP